MNTSVESSSEVVISPIEDIIAELKAGNMVIVTDDPDRENEGDIICAAQTITPEQISFMVTHARGLICTPLSGERCDALGLPLMTSFNRESMSTAFTVSVDAAKGVTTGISSFDRARTIGLLGDPDARPDDFVQPGHIFPLRAVEGGVLRRSGHTEATVDLMRIAGLELAGVCCEIMNDDGTMARLGDLGAYQRKHGLKIGTIADLIEYRRKKEVIVEHIETVRLPTDYGDFTCHLYESLIDRSAHLALVAGEIDPEKPVLVRVHSECLTGDVFGSRRCDCGSQLHAALRRIAEEGGVLLYLRQEGRGIGLSAKIKAYKLQENGLDTVDANLQLGYPADLRDYGMGAQMLHDLGVRHIKLLTNNPKKVVGLKGHDLEIVEQIPIAFEPHEDNCRYLDAKRTRLGHLL